MTRQWTNDIFSTKFCHSRVSNRKTGPHTLVKFHDDVIKWKHFPRYRPFVRGNHRSSVNSPHKGQWRGALMFSLNCARINGWVNNRETGDLRRHLAYYDVPPNSMLLSRNGSDKNIHRYHHRNHSLYAPSQWETTVYCNVVSHWLGAHTKPRPCWFDQNQI